MAKREHKPATHTEETKRKISQSLLNNSNAEYWTRDLVIYTLEQMIEYATTVYEVVQKTKEESNPIGDKIQTEKVKRKPHLKSSILIHFRIFYVEWFSDMRQKFMNDTTVSQLVKAIDMICEANTYEDAANSASNQAMAKAHLANHYGWIDRTETTTKDIPMTKEELEVRVREYEKRNGIIRT